MLYLYGTIQTTTVGRVKKSCQAGGPIMIISNEFTRMFYENQSSYHYRHQHDCSSLALEQQFLLHFLCFKLYYFTN